MNSRRRRILWGLSIFGTVFLIVTALVWRVATSRPPIESVPLSNGKYNIRFLKADVGTLGYSSDDQLTAFLRRALPGPLVRRKLGEVINIRGYTAYKEAGGGPPLILLFQLLTPGNQLQQTTSTVFGKIEFLESTGFMFTEDINGYSSHGAGTSLHDFGSFPRRDPTLRFRLYETGEPGKLLMEKEIPNPGYQSQVTEWTPAVLPQTQQAEEVKVTLKSLKIDSERRRVFPEIEVDSSDAGWLKPKQLHHWSDATGNTGSWLSPFEPAWKLHLTLLRRRDAQFPAAAIWKFDPQSLPVGLTLTEVKKQQVVDGIGVCLRYVAPAGEISDEGGKVTIKPPSSPGRTGLSTSSGGQMQNGVMVRHYTIESGMPFIRVDHDPLPAGVELLFDVRDEHGVLLNKDLYPGNGSANGVQFYAIYFKPGPETRTVQLELRVNRPRDVEFLVAPPEALRAAIQKQTPAR